MRPSSLHTGLRIGPGLLVSFVAIALAGFAGLAHAVIGAEADRDSLVATPDSLQVDSTRVASLRVYLEGGRMVPAGRVEPLPNGLLRVVSQDGSVEHLPIARVRRIEDERGDDRTSEVVEAGKTLRRGNPLHPAPPDRPKRWRSFQFEPAPKSECGGFIITEVVWLGRVGGPSEVTGDSQYGRSDLGAMRNVGPRSALGAAVFAGGSPNQVQIGVCARGRYWLSRRVGLDAAPGLIVGSDQLHGPEFRGPGIATRIGVIAEDIVGLSLQVSSVRYAPDRYKRTPSSETSWSIGVVWGSSGGAAIMLGSLVVSAVAAAR